LFNEVKELELQHYNEAEADSNMITTFQDEQLKGYKKLFAEQVSVPVDKSTPPS